MLGGAESPNGEAAAWGEANGEARCSGEEGASQNHSAPPKAKAPLLLWSKGCVLAKQEARVLQEDKEWRRVILEGWESASQTLEGRGSLRAVGEVMSMVVGPF